MKFTSSVSERLEQALAASPMGPREVSSRPLSKMKKASHWGWGFIGGLILMNIGFANLSKIEPQINRLQTFVGSHVSTSVPFQGFSNETLFQAEDAFRVGHYEKASRLFQSQNQATPDIQVASWALRAAAMSGSEEEIEKSGNSYNTTLDIVSAQSGKSFSTSWRWKPLQSADQQIDQWKKTSSHVVPKVAEAFKQWREASPGYFAFLGLKGVSDEEVVKDLENQGFKNLARFLPEYRVWVSRHPTSAERFQEAINYKSMIEEGGKTQSKVTVSVESDNAPHSILLPLDFTSESLSSPESDTVYSPKNTLSGVSPDVFINTYLGKGFTPIQIFHLWKEHEMLGDESHEVQQDLLHRSPYENQIQNLRTQARQWLKEVKSPSDFQLYYQHWGAAADANPELFSRFPGSPSSTLRLGGLQADDINWLDRVEGHAGFKSDPNPKDFGVSELQSALSDYVLDLPDVQTRTPKNLTLLQAKTKLQEVLVETGIRRISWPFHMKATPEKLWQVANLLTQANHEMEQKTNWSGAVLGLKGHIDLTLGSKVLNGRAGATILNTTSNIISNSDSSSTSPLLNSEKTDPAQHSGAESYALIEVVLSQKSLGALGHEWTHALDELGSLNLNNKTSPFGLAGSTSADLYSDAPVVKAWANLCTLFEKQTSRDLTKKAWENLWAKLRAPNIDVEKVQMAEQSAWLNSTLLSLPMFRSVLSQELADVRANRWSLKSSNERWENAEAPNMMKIFKTEINQAQLQLENLQKMQAQKYSSRGGLSPWMNASIKIGGEYWGNPQELAARSFAAQFPPSTVISDDNLTDSLAEAYNPTHTERLAQRPAWSDFFQTLNPWWENMEPARQKSQGELDPSQVIFASQKSITKQVLKIDITQDPISLAPTIPVKSHKR